MTESSSSAAAPAILAGLRVLVVDDEADLRLGLRRLLGGVGAMVSEAADGEEALSVLTREPTDLVLTDLQMPRMTGADLLAEVQQRWPSIPVVVFTGYGTIETAVSCLQNGASHFLTKPVDNSEILELVGRLGRQALAGRDPDDAHGRNDGELIATDPAMCRVLELVERVAASPVPVLLSGESGTGKEVVARALHRQSRVASEPFLAVNAAALPDTLLESELFGHARGSFTGATSDRAGLFVEAGEGTVFLDEVSSMSPSFQSKLLRVLQERLVRPLGCTTDVPVAFRLIAATNRNLEDMIRRGEFREDLFYRLRVVSIHVPTLRERPADIEPLALHFLHRAAQNCLPSGTAVPELSAEALSALKGHAWPGNVRELENTIQRAVVVCYGPRILPHHLGLEDQHWNEPPSDPQDYEAEKRRAIDHFQREFIQRALERTAGNVSQAAEACGLTRAAFQRIMRAHDIDRESFRR